MLKIVSQFKEPLGSTISGKQPTAPDTRCEQ